MPTFTSEFSNLETEFKKLFPNGFYESSVSSTGRLYLKLGLIGDLNVVPWRIRENDPMHHVFWIDQQNDKFATEELTGGLACDPLSEYYAMSFTKTKFRKSTGDIAKINKHLVKFFNNLHSIVIENADKIYHREMYAGFIPEAK